MAVRKETIKQQMSEALKQALEPGERQVGGIFVIAGTSPWIAQGLLGLLGQFLVDYYFVALTDRRVVFIRTSRVSGRAKEIAFSEPRSPDPIVEYELKPLWSVVRFRHGDGKPMRLNVHRIWRNELQEFLAAFGKGESPMAPPAGTSQVPPPG